MFPRLERIELDAALGAGLVAGVHAGLLLQIWSLDWIHYFGWTVGNASLSVSWLVLLVGSSVAALLLTTVFDRLNYSAVTRLLGFRQRHARVGRLLGLPLRVSVLGTALAIIGVGGGLVVGVVGYGLLLPLWLNVGFGRQLPVPFVPAFSLVAWVVYGLLLGFLYGAWTKAPLGPGWE